MAAVLLLLTTLSRADGADFATKSGIGIWVDPATPDDRQTYISTRGDEWQLVMSDEFNTPDRSFKPNDDHIWTSIDKPDGVNKALEVYSHNMTSTKCDDDGTCYFYIMATDEATTLKLWNDYKNPPGYQTTTFYYRSAMVQSWNKFCFQGGMVEVRAQLPGAVSSASGNPDVAVGPSAQATTKKYYPTWPGIWMMGNLGRAIFSASTNRMWPFSYNECNDDVFLSSNQRISACDSNPGSGMNPNQGRGAPEIDILEGAGNEVSSSIQVGPGMPTDYRIIYPTEDASAGCVYTGSCKTKGANAPDLPTAYYKTKRGHKSWYQGLRYAANNFCAASASLKQDYKTVKANVDKGVTENACTLTNCAGSKDPNADLSLIDNSQTDHWSINTNGTCFPTLNGYTGAYLCSPGNTDELCEKSDAPKNDNMKVFAYQMDAISSNWPIHVAAYTSYLTYQLEWVMGDTGYVRWMLAGQPLFEIPASAIVDPPQNAAKSNPKKLMLEEPMYLILNVALSSTWGTTPPNPGKECRGDGTDAVANKICDSFPMYMKIDYIRVYQDTSKNSIMAVGCDPKTHPTKQWIQDHIEEYQDYDNLVVDVSGKAFCRDNDDCTISPNKTKVATGTCVKNRCKCAGSAWTGPRCTSSLKAVESSISGGGSSGTSTISTSNSYGPPWSVALSASGITVLLTMLMVHLSIRSEAKTDASRKRQMLMQPKSAMSIGALSELGVKELNLKDTKDAPTVAPPIGNYSTNFV
uniref:GH16 domain-containing protein n=1 Tax=Globisporangium ultimum (strain ATCC 200006 / CBS 805.95 / DAOM BR144) TaxID=431595 RepID=K3X0H8_GLOUD